MFKLFVLAALVAVAAAAPGAVVPSVISTYTAPVVSAPFAYQAPLAYSGYAASPYAYSASPYAYSGTPYAYRSGYYGGYNGAYASPYSWVH